MTKKRFTTNGYKIYDTFHDGIHWLVNQVEANEIVDKMNNLDSKARERSKALSKLQKENEKLKIFLKAVNEELSLANRDCDILEEENKQLKQAYSDAKSDVEGYEEILKDIMEDNLLIQDMRNELKE